MNRAVGLTAAGEPGTEGGQLKCTGDDSGERGAPVPALRRQDRGRTVLGRVQSPGCKPEQSLGTFS